MPLVAVDVQLPFQNTSEDKLVVVNKVYVSMQARHSSGTKSGEYVSK